MTLKERLSQEMKTAMKSQDKNRLTFARNLHGAIRKKEIDDRVDLDDGAVCKVIQTLAKQRRESIEQFKKGGRADLVAIEEEELKFLLSYMPEQMSGDEIRKKIDEVIAQTKASSPKDLGLVMKTLLPQVEGRADSKMISQIVREKLSQGT